MSPNLKPHDLPDLSSVGKRIKYARHCRGIDAPMLVKYRRHWAPADWQPRNPTQWLQRHESGPVPMPYPLEVAEGLARILQVPLEWVLGDVDPFPPPLLPLTPVERLYLDGGIRRHADRWIQSQWRKGIRAGLRI